MEQEQQTQFIVTLDGPAGVGKTTLAKRVADALGIAYLDTGAMFRTMALRLGEDIHACPEAEIRTRAQSLHFALQGSGSLSQLLCNGEVVGDEIRTEEVGRMASLLAAVPVVREVLKDVQRQMGEEMPLVVEGRDMGTVVFPRARFKFFLDASPRVRALRRMGDLKALGQTISLADLERQIRERDDRDRNRPVAPLRPAEDAYCVDTSNMGIDEVLQTILRCIEDLKEKGTARAVPLLAGCMEAVRARRHLVHFITNYVTVNDCANMTIAAGASPIMADAPEEMESVTTLCQGLVLNLGTLNKRTASSMQLAGRAARKAGHAIILDPVGAGISDLRNETIHTLVSEAAPSVIKGNSSEILFLARGTGKAQGVDAAEADLTNSGNVQAHAAMARKLAAELSCVIVISGAIDIVADARKAYAVSNGHALMERVSGTGCMLAAVLGGFVAASPQSPLEASLAAVVAMGLAGEHASARMGEGAGSGTYRMLLIDAMSTLEPGMLDAEARVERLL